MNMGTSLPGVTTRTKPKRLALDDVQLSSLVYGDPIVIESGTTDAGSSRSTLLRPGGVYMKKTGSTKFVAVTNVHEVDQGTPAAITSAEAVDAGWASKTLTLFRNGVKVAEVTVGGADDTAAEWVTALHADVAFRANATASDSSGSLVITDNLGGGDALRVEVDLDTAYDNAFDSSGGSSNDSSYEEAIGTVPDVRVILDEVDMLDGNATAIDGHSARNVWAGHFKTADLVSGGTLGTIPASAQGIFQARGSRFTA